jgi:hypothetical protein
VDFSPSKPYFPGMARHVQAIGIFGLLIFSAGLASAQSGSAVSVEQVAAPRASANASAIRIQPIGARGSTSTADGAVRTVQNAPVAPPRQIVEACASAEIGGTAPEGVDCPAILRAAAAAAAAEAPARTAEGTLLTLFGQRSTVTQSTGQRPINALDPDGVARQLSTGDGSGATSGDAAAIAARQRSSPPPSSPPR